MKKKPIALVEADSNRLLSLIGHLRSQAKIEEIAASRADNPDTRALHSVMRIDILKNAAALQRALRALGCQGTGPDIEVPSMPSPEAAKVDALRALLDADRGQDEHTGGPRFTLREIFCSEVAWALWWRTRSYDNLRAISAGAWDANLLDREAAAWWELARRDAGVSDATVAQWLGIEWRQK